ncbi:UNVERIFIED_CONTAM: hypothetical protein GTU68_044141 [Idotea baltica]|nr:hypothetical protein [Idotea baltica]
MGAKKEDRSTWAGLFKTRQQEICTALELLEPTARFTVDTWTRSESSPGLSRVLTDGIVFEQAGVNFSEVNGTLPFEMSAKLVGVKSELPFYATGVSLVIHPLSAHLPTVHANYRYLEVADKAWFGGGADLYALRTFIQQNAVHFHSNATSRTCDRYDDSFYPLFKRQCDEYFYLPHRGESRGLGGIFFDYLGRDDSAHLPKAAALVTDLSSQFLESYLPIVDRHIEKETTQEERDFQLYRRGRYVEFNLLHDRGTLFGLKTGGRVESILMSLPPLAAWSYDKQLTADQLELTELLKHPRAWLT